MGQLLYIDGTVRGEDSRTRKLALAVLGQLENSYEIKELALEAEHLCPLDRLSLSRRDELCQRKQFQNPEFRYARDFQQADAIVLAAPYWDFSFPSMVRVYLEHISVNGIVFGYEEDGSVTGLCRAEKLLYVTTVGGFIGEQDFGFLYLKALADRFGIPQVQRIACEGLDIVGTDVEAKLSEACSGCLHSI